MASKGVMKGKLPLVMDSREGRLIAVSILTLGREVSVPLPWAGRSSKAQGRPSAPWKPREVQSVHTS